MSSLGYLEVHLVDHCNLNCKGCAHFSPLCKAWFLNIDDFTRDLIRLKSEVTNIDLFRLMGGEPLLHNNLLPILTVTRSIYQDSRIVLVTNGILIPEQNKEFFNTLITSNIELQITVYPDKRQNVKSYLEILQEFEIKTEVFYTKEFCKHLKLKSTRNAIESIKKCREKQFCPTMKNGFLFQCSGLAHINNFYNYFYIDNLPLPTGYNIYSYDFSFEKIIEFLNRPDEICAHCFYSYDKYKWQKSGNKIDEWTEI
jgi:organic radical activating enzyme